MISIVVPVHNTEQYIARCIESVLLQKYQDYELILIDDHSMDKSLEICRKYEKENACISVFQAIGQGVSSARNFGIEKCKGEFVVFLDSDDQLTDDALLILYEAIQKYDFAMATYHSVYRDGEVLSHQIEEFSGDLRLFLGRIYDYILKNILQGPCWKIFSLRMIKNHGLRFPPNMQYGEDAHFVYEYLEKCKRINVVNRVVYKYSIFSHSLSHGFKEEKIYTNIMLDKKIQLLCAANGIDNTEQSYEYLMSCYTALINEAARELGLFETRRRIKKSYAIKEIKLSFEKASSMSLKKRVMHLLSKYGLFFCLSVIGKLNSIGAK